MWRILITIGLCGRASNKQLEDKQVLGIENMSKMLFYWIILNYTQFYLIIYM